MRESERCFVRASSTGLTGLTCTCNCALRLKTACNYSSTMTLADDLFITFVDLIFSHTHLLLNHAGALAGRSMCAFNENVY